MFYKRKSDFFDSLLGNTGGNLTVDGALCLSRASLSGSIRYGPNRLKCRKIRLLRTSSQAGLPATFSIFQIAVDKTVKEIMTSSVFAYVDESGNLPNPDDRYVVVAAIVTANAHPLRNIIRKAGHKLKKAHFKKRRGREVKWSNASDGARNRVLHALARRDVDIFWVAFDKNGRSIADTPDNYGLLVGELMQECLAYHPDLRLFIDVHFTAPIQRERFNHILTETFHLPVPPTHLDSQSDASIQLADFVAGAVLYQLTSKGTFIGILEQKVVVGKIIQWPRLRQKKKR